MKKTKGILLMGMLMLVVVGAYYMAGTYAKYTSSVVKTGTAAVAKWAFTEHNTAGTLTLNITPAADASTLVGGTIAPGTSGSFNIEVDNTETQVGINVLATIAIKNGCSNAEKTTQETCNGEDEVWYNTPANLKFYTDAEHITALGVEGVAGVVEAGEKLSSAEEAQGPAKTIYWTWPYETTNGDASDTSDGIEAGTFGVDVTITGTQVTPSTTAITTGWE